MCSSMLLHHNHRLDVALAKSHCLPQLPAECGTVMIEQVLLHVQVGQSARDLQGGHPRLRAANLLRQRLCAGVLQQHQLPR